MPTQTGSIDFKSTKGLKSYAEAQYATQGQVTTLNTAIEQNARDISFRATKEEAAQMAQPNLVPWFSAGVPELPSTYWKYGAGTGARAIQHTDMGDGWCHIVLDNSSGTSSIRYDYDPVAAEGIELGKNYTFLFELRNIGSASSTNTQIYAVQAGTYGMQFWGNYAQKLLEGYGTSCTIALSTTLAQSGGNSAVLCDDGIYRKRVVRVSEASDSTYWTRSDDKRCVRLVTFCAAGDVFDAEFRFSIYQGDYDGPYKPYVGSQLYALQAELKVANDAISLRATKEEVEKTYSTKEDSQLDRAGSGTSVAIDGAANAALKGLHVLGESVQDGTPTPSAPVPIVSVSGVNLLPWSDENDIYADHSAVDRRWMFYSIYGPTVVDGNTVTFTKNSDGLTNNTSGIRVSAMLASGAAACSATSESLSFGLDLKAGDTLTFSCDVKTSGNRVALHAQYYNGSSRWASAGDITEYGAPADTDWHRYSHTFTVASNYVSLTALGIYCELTDGVTISARNFKLEIGGTSGLYVPHDSFGLWVHNDETESVTPIPLNGHELRSLPDGTQDELTVDTDGHVTMTQRVGSYAVTGSETPTGSAQYGDYRRIVVTNAVPDDMRSTPTWGATNKGLCSHAPFVFEQTGQSTHVYFAGRTLALFYPTTVSADVVTAFAGATLIYPLETPQTIDLGTIDMPQVKDGDTVEVIAALTPSIDVTWWASAGQAVADAYASLSSAIEVRAESIVSTVSERYATSDAVDAIATQITQTATSWTAAFNQLRYGDDEEPTDDNKKLKMTLAQAFEALGVTSENLDELRSYVRIATDAQNKPYLLMGSEKSPIMMALTNDSLRFMHGSDPVAYIDVDGETNEGELHITRATIDNELRFGSKELGSVWRWHVRANGNLALGWTSGTGGE